MSSPYLAPEVDQITGIHRACGMEVTAQPGMGTVGCRMATGPLHRSRICQAAKADDR
jgi:hypothetical protein